MEYEYPPDPHLASSTVNPLNGTWNEMDYLNPPATPLIVAVEIIKFVICVVGTLTYLLIVYIIFMYKNMQKPVNIYIMNWMISGSLLILVDPSENRLYQLLDNMKIEREVICIMDSCMVIVATTNVLFMLMIIFHRFAADSKCTSFDRHCCKVVAVVWISVFAEFLIISAPCVYKNMYRNLGEILLCFLFLLFLVCFVVMHCARRCGNPFSKTSSLPIALLTSFVLSWVTAIIGTVFIEIGHYRMTRYMISFIILDLGKMILYFYPLIAFYLFYKKDVQFAICLRTLCRKQAPEDADVGAEELEEPHETDHLQA